ncbi:MAG: nucleoside hydrolase [Beijerinckiaceae bacterium]
MRRKLILDVDTGTDDAVAIMLAALHPALDLVACTTVNGNVELEYCTDNTLRVLDLVGRADIPVYEGLARPLARHDFPKPRRKGDLLEKIHGKALPLPETSLRKADRGAVEFLIETYRAATEEITLVPVAPLTNIAAALALDPKFVERVPEVMLMGGGHEISNVTPAAEFNIWADPEAAAMVFSAGFRKITMVPLDATHRALVTEEDCARLEKLGRAGEAAALLVRHRIGVHDRIQRMSVRTSAPVHDALCVAFLIDPSLMKTRHVHVAVETHGRHTIGRTVIDMQARGDDAPNCHVAYDPDAHRFHELLSEAFARGP